MRINIGRYCILKRKPYRHESFCKDIYAPYVLKCVSPLYNMLDLSNLRTSLLWILFHIHKLSYTNTSTISYQSHKAMENKEYYAFLRGDRKSLNSESQSNSPMFLEKTVMSQKSWQSLISRYSSTLWHILMTCTVLCIIVFLNAINTRYSHKCHR